MQANKRLRTRFIKWAMKSSNREQIASLHLMCGANNSPFEYLFGDKYSLQDKIDIDFIVRLIGNHYQTERMKELENEAKDG